MTPLSVSQVRGTFRGWKYGNTYETTAGQRWRQVSNNVEFQALPYPTVRVFQDGGGYRLQVDGMRATVAVVPA